MTPFSTRLALLLLVQMLLVFVVFWPGGNEAEDAAQEQLLVLDAGSLQRIVVSDGETSLVLAQSESQWRLPDYHNLPVSAEKLAAVQTDLPGQPRGWPIATSSSAGARFEVAADTFQRRIEYYGDDSDSAAQTLYLGSSPGFRKVHARVRDSDAVYAITFNTFDVPVQPAQWFDKKLLQVKEITRVEGLDYTMQRNGDNWQDDAQRVAAREQATSLSNGLTNLRVDAVADQATATLLAELAAPPTLQVAAATGRFEFRLYEIDQAFYIQRADIPLYFSLSELDYQRLNGAGASTLYPDPADASGSGSGAEPAATEGAP